MTAPLTPHEQPPPFPPYPGGQAASGGTGDGRRALIREVLIGVLIAVAVAACGIILGLLWAWLSPQIPYISDGRAIYPKDTEGEQAIGGDGTFAIIAAVLGAVTAGLVFWRFRRGGIAVVIGLAVGGLLASWIGWRLGMRLGPTSDIRAHARAVGPNKVFYGPLEIRAGGVLVLWSAAAMLVHLCLTSAFGPRDPEPLLPPPPPLPAEPTPPAA